jgi:predicted nuclease with TOPRIM domain
MNLLYEKIAEISNQKSQLMLDNERLIDESVELKKKIDELEKKVKELESGISVDKISEFIDQMKEKLITEIKEAQNGKDGTQE